MLMGGDIKGGKKKSYKSQQYVQHPIACNEQVVGLIEKKNKITNNPKGDSLKSLS